jgi:hypothetical protein
MDERARSCGSTPVTDPSGRLDEALERLHRSGPERDDWLSNHAPMAVEALAHHGQARAVHGWIDHYADKLEDMPGPLAAVTDENWREALGDPRRLADWIGYFTRQVHERPWPDVLGLWWPRLLPGISGAATHPVIRVGHAVRTLLLEPAEAMGESAGPRQVELAHALGYWAARHHPLEGIAPLPPAASAAEGLAAVPRIADQSGGIRERLPRITALPAHPGQGGPEEPSSAREVLREVVRAATHRYATHAHGQPVMLVHAATAPNAVLRTLPALPRRLWLPSLEAAWSASAAVTAVYGPATGSPVPEAGSVSAGEVFERAAAHGDEHAIKLADTAVDVAGWTDGEEEPALAAALRAIELIEPAA